MARCHRRETTQQNRGGNTASVPYSICKHGCPAGIWNFLDARHDQGLQRLADKICKEGPYVRLYRASYAMKVCGVFSFL